MNAIEVPSFVRLQKQDILWTTEIFAYSNMSWVINTTVANRSYICTIANMDNINIIYIYIYCICIGFNIINTRLTFDNKCIQWFSRPKFLKIKKTKDKTDKLNKRTININQTLERIDIFIMEIYFVFQNNFQTFCKTFVTANYNTFILQHYLIFTKFN